MREREEKEAREGIRSQWQRTNRIKRGGRGRREHWAEMSGFYRKKQSWGKGSKVRRLERFRVGVRRVERSRPL